jgi:hypothetical protein
MRALILAATLLLPLAAQAQQAPPQFAVPSAVLNHVVAFLSNGGTHLEGQALAEQLIALAQAQMAAQKAPEAPAR